MMSPRKIRIWTPGCMGLALGLAACSTPRVAAMAPEQTAPVIGGGVSRGIIAAARPVQLSTDQIGLNGVMAALHEPMPPAAPANATEFVIQRGDDSTVSMVTQDNFSVGGKVEVVDGDPPELIQGN